VSKDPRDDLYKDDPMRRVRKPTPPPGRVIHGKKYNKHVLRRKEQDLIEDGMEEYEELYK
jgi:hypothetical protein